MKKLKMAANQAMTVEEGCNKHLQYCRHRNLREGTIDHYRQSYTQFYKFFDRNLHFISFITFISLCVVLNAETEITIK